MNLSNEDSKKIVDRIYEMRKNFVIVGLVGRTGSGCSTVAEILQADNIKIYKSNYSEFNDKSITNQTRKDRIVYNFLNKNWHSFTSIKASDVIFYYALKLDIENFAHKIAAKPTTSSGESKGEMGQEITVEENQNIYKAVKDLEETYSPLSNKVKECEEFLNRKEYLIHNEESNLGKIESFTNLITKEINEFRKALEKIINAFSPHSLTLLLQVWGNNIRMYNDISPNAAQQISDRAPSCLASKINQFIKMIREGNKIRSIKNDSKQEPTLIVIDALRNPFEILYFRERYSAYYTVSVNTDRQTRHANLFKKGYKIDDINNIDKEEEEKKELGDRFRLIDVDKCIELSDIFITHDGTPIEYNHNLINQIYTYLALIYHPGLVPPSSIERVMQVAYTAKLNSGCLSRQVGAAVTNEYFSIKSVGWNTTAEGQTPCSLRNLSHLCNQEDDVSFSNYEKGNQKFREYANLLRLEYDKVKSDNNQLEGLNISYCFKDIYTSVESQKQKGNQVHTRSLHAEENAFLQLAKYGCTGIKNGKLFTTASCCELCGKKAYQLGIKEIYYIDSYPGITKEHILECGLLVPKVILFSGAIGRAYIELYDQLMPLKDEISALSGVNPKLMNTSSSNNSKESLDSSTNGTDSKNKQS